MSTVYDESVEQTIKLYLDGYKQIVKELGEKYDEIAETLRKSGVTSIEITINIEACEIPSYNIKYNYIPDLSKPI